MGKYHENPANVAAELRRLADLIDRDLAHVKMYKSHRASGQTPPTSEGVELQARVLRLIYTEPRRVRVRPAAPRVAP